MALDPSVIIPEQQPQINPLQILTQVQGLRNAQGQNQLLQNSNQEFQLRQQAGNIVTNALTQNTDAQGNVNYGAVRNAIMQAGQGNPFISDALQGNLTAQGTDLTNQRTAQALSQDKIATLRANHSVVMGTLDGLLSKPTLTRDDVVAAGSQLISDPSLDKDTRQNLTKEVIGTIGSIPADATDPQIRQIIKQQHGMLLNAEQQFNAAYGAPTMVDTGGSIQPVSVNAVQGSAAPMGNPIEKTLSPEAAAQPVAGPVTNSGAPTTVPLGQRQGMGTIQTALGPSGSAAGTATGAASAQEGIALQQRADQAPQNRALLENLDQELGKIKTGPGADWTQVAKTFVNRNSPFGNVFDPSKIASQEEFTKQATQLAQSQFAAIGGTGTDAKLNSAMHTSPSTALSNLGNHEIISLLRGNEDALAAKNQAWQDWVASGHAPDSYGQFSTNFNKIYDPRVFQSRYLSPTERQQLVKSMTPAELSAFRKSYNVAAQQGWLGQ